MTQREVADALGVSQATVSAWERDQWRPPKSQWRKLCEMLGITRKQIEEALARTEYAPDPAAPQTNVHVPIVGTGSGKTMAMVTALMAAMERHETKGRQRAAQPDVFTMTWPDGTVTVIEAKTSREGIAVLTEIDARLGRLETVMSRLLDLIGERG